MFLDVQRQVSAIKVTDALLDYLQALLAATRADEHFAQGLSPRAGLALKHAAQAWAYLEGRDFVLPEDIQAVFPSVAGHRLQDAQGLLRGEEGVKRIMASVAIP